MQIITSWNIRKTSTYYKPIETPWQPICLETNTSKLQLHHINYNFAQLCIMLKVFLHKTNDCMYVTHTNTNCIIRNPIQTVYHLPDSIKLVIRTLHFGPVAVPSEVGRRVTFQLPSFDNFYGNFGLLKTKNLQAENYWWHSSLVQMAMPSAHVWLTPSKPYFQTHCAYLQT